MTSIRSRLTMLLLCGVALLVVTAGLLLENRTTHWVEDEFDHALETKARALITLTKQEHGEVELDFADEFMPEFESEDDPYYFELWLDIDALLERSNSFELSQAQSEAPLPKSRALEAAPRFADLRLPDGRPGRIVQIDFVPQLEDDDINDEQAHDPARVTPSSGRHAATILVARERQTLNDQINRLRWALALFLAVLLATLAALVAVALKLGFKPIDSLSDQMAGIGASSLDRRVSLDPCPSELKPIVDQLNGLLQKIETAFRRERQLTADIAHELKTPIAELRTLSEVGGRWPDDASATQSFFAETRELALQMERIVGHLLVLARYDEGKETKETVAVNIASACEEAWLVHAAGAVEKHLQFHSSIPQDAVLHIDPGRLRLILSNLFSNAVEYSRANTEITCRYQSSNGGSTLDVLNFVEDLEPEDLKVMFDRFWRKDEARSGGQHIGLGLAIVESQADILGFEVTAKLAPDGLLRVRLTTEQQPS